METDGYTMTNTAYNARDFGFEEIIARHCGPALAGIKPSNLVSCSNAGFGNLDEKISLLNSKLNRSDIYIEKICERDTTTLILVYKKRILGSYLNMPEILGLLKKIGYKKCENVTGYIKQLKERMTGESFPHEIGAFLGYPIDDIYGFIENKRQKCLLVGEWKVYKNAERAAELFRRYKCCRCAILKQIARGKTLAQIFAA